MENKLDKILEKFSEKQIKESEKLLKKLDKTYEECKEIIEKQLSKLTKKPKRWKKSNFEKPK